MTDYLFLLAAMVVLLLAKGFFSGSEIALVSSDKLKLRSRADRGDRRAALVLRLFRKPESLLATTLIGTNIATMTLTVLGTATVIRLLGAGGDLYAVMFLTPVMLILGEIVPKSIFQQQADSIAPKVAPPLAALRALLMPIVLAFGWVGRRIAASVAPSATTTSPFVTRQRLRLMLESAERAAEVPVLDRDRIRRAVQLSSTTVGEAMVPLARVVGAEKGTPLAEIVAIGREAGHRRVPLYERNLSNIVSIATWTVWDEGAPGFADRAVETVAVEPLFVSTLQRLDDLFPILVARSDRMAVAVDEFGTAAGIVTIEDLMVILLGSVAHAVHLGPRRWEQEANIEKQGGDAILVDAGTRLMEVAEHLEVELPIREFHSVGGFLTGRLRRIPVVGDAIEEQGYRFTVTEATSRAAVRVRVEPVPLA